MKRWLVEYWVALLALGAWLWRAGESLWSKPMDRADQVFWCVAGASWVVFYIFKRPDK